MNLVNVLRHPVWGFSCPSEAVMWGMPWQIFTDPHANPSRDKGTDFQTTAKTGTWPSPNKGTVCQFFILWLQEDMEESAGVLLLPQDLSVLLLWAELWLLAQSTLLPFCMGTQHNDSSKGVVSGVLDYLCNEKQDLHQFKRLFQWHLCCKGRWGSLTLEQRASTERFPAVWRTNQ